MISNSLVAKSDSDKELDTAIMNTHKRFKVFQVKQRRGSIIEIANILVIITKVQLFKTLKHLSRYYRYSSYDTQHEFYSYLLKNYKRNTLTYVVEFEPHQQETYILYMATSSISRNGIRYAYLSENEALENVDDNIFIPNDNVYMYKIKPRPFYRTIDMPIRTYKSDTEFQYIVFYMCSNFYNAIGSPVPKNNITWKTQGYTNIQYAYYNGNIPKVLAIEKKELVPVIVKNGKIIMNEDNARLAKLLNQPYAFIEL